MGTWWTRIKEHLQVKVGKYSTRTSANQWGRIEKYYWLQRSWTFHGTTHSEMMVFFLFVFAFVMQSEKHCLWKPKLKVWQKDTNKCRNVELILMLDSKILFLFITFLISSIICICMYIYIYIYIVWLNFYDTQEKLLIIFTAVLEIYDKQ